MKKDYILTQIGAFGVCDDFEFDSQRDIFPEKALASVRLFGGDRLRIQPLLIKREETIGRYSKELTEKSVAVSCFGLFYQLTVDDSVISQSNLLDSIYAALALLEHVGKDILLFPISAVDIPVSRVLTKEEALQLYRHALPNVSSLFANSVFDSQWHSTFQFDQTLWEIVTRIADNEKVIFACNFLMSSYSEYQFMGDSIGEVILAHEEVPQYINEAVKLENAIHNCYKVVEAICGGTLPTSQKKLKNKLENIGIDPNELVGYETYGVFKKEKIITKIEALRLARNERAAHGRIHKDRKSTFYELMDYQSLANALLVMFIRHEYADIPI